MIVKVDKTFEKDTNKIKDKNLLNEVAACIEVLQLSENVKYIKNIKKLKGSNSFYQIRLVDYRMGLR